MLPQCLSRTLEDSGTVTTVTPAGLTPAIVERIQEVARRTFQGLKMQDLSRIDFFLTPEGEVLGLRKKRLPKGGLTWRSLERGMVVCHQSFIVRRSIAPLYDTERYRLAADIDWVIECLKRAERIVDTGLILSCFTTGGVSTRRRRASLRERWRIMRHHYGLWRTGVAHVGFVWGMLLDKLLRRPAYRPCKPVSKLQ